MSSSTSSTELWAGLAAAIASTAALARKLLSHKQPKAEHITWAEFHHELNALRDRMGASCLAMGEQVNANHREMLAALERQAAQLCHLQAALSRVEERSRPSAFSPQACPFCRSQIKSCP